MHSYLKWFSEYDLNQFHQIIDWKQKCLFSLKMNLFFVLNFSINRIMFTIKLIGVQYLINFPLISFCWFPKHSSGFSCYKFQSNKLNLCQNQRHIILAKSQIKIQITQKFKRFWVKNLRNFSEKIWFDSDLNHLKRFSAQLQREDKSLTKFLFSKTFRQMAKHFLD